VTDYRLEYRSRPWTLNVERQGHHHHRARLVAEWRRAFDLLAREARVPAMSAVSVIAAPRVKDRRSIPDTAACVGAVKAAIDGLRDAGVLVDDGPDVVRTVTFLAPEVRGYDSLVLHVAPVAVAVVA